MTYATAKATLLAGATENGIKFCKIQEIRQVGRVRQA